MKASPSNPRFLFDRLLLPTGLVLALLISLLWYGGEDVVRRASVMPLNQWLIFTIFFISGLRLQINHLFDEALPLNSFLPVSAVQFLVAPLSALMLGWILQIPEAWFIGLAAICCVPTTLSSGIVLTRQAEGNELLALVLTLVLTLMGTLLTPILFGLLLGTSVAIDLAVGSMILKLCLLVLVPLVLGQLVRKFILRRPPSYLKHLPSICVILTVWLAAQGNSSALRELPWYAWICFALISLSLHICWFGLIWIFAEKNGIHRRNQTAMALIGSQKTLPFAITVLTIALSSGSIADSLPVAISFVVIFHLTQVLTDSLLAPRLAQDPTSHE